MHPLRSAERAASIQMFLADPPRVHDGAPGGVWGTSTDCYEFMASHLPDNPATLETGLGLSTLMLGRWAGRHTCVVGSQAQVDALQAHARNRGYSLANTRFAVGSSDQVLPSLQLEPSDLFLIDGGHGYPMPVIDWVLRVARAPRGRSRRRRRHPTPIGGRLPGSLPARRPSLAPGCRGREVGGLPQGGGLLASGGVDGAGLPRRSSKVPEPETEIRYPSPDRRAGSCQSPRAGVMTPGRPTALGRRPRGVASWRSGSRIRLRWAS